MYNTLLNLLVWLGLKAQVMCWRIGILPNMYFISTCNYNKFGKYASGFGVRHIFTIRATRPMWLGQFATLTINLKKGTLPAIRVTGWGHF
jgi:hypothetical protein